VVLGTAQNPADPTKPVRINRIITGILIFKILFLAVLFVRSSIRIVGKHWSSPRSLFSPFLVSKIQHAIRIAVLTAIILTKYAVASLLPAPGDVMHLGIR
jgi:hypothetical protein